MSNTLILILVLGYGVVCLLVGARGKGKIKTSEGFFMGDRSLGILISCTSVTMGILSGLAFFGSPALVMRSGNLILCTMGFGVMGLVYPWYGYKLWKYGKNRNFMTTADYMRARYDSGGYATLVAVLQLVFMIPYLTVQFVAVGNGLSYFTDISYGGAILVFSLFLIAGIFIGGAKGVGTMDVFNAALGMLVPLVLVILCVKGAGGGVAIGEMAMKNDPYYLDPSGGAGVLSSGLSVFTYWMSAFFAIMFSPHIIAKMFMVKDIKTFQQMTVLGPLTHVLVCVPIFAMGWVGIALYKPELMASGMTDFLIQTALSDYGNVILVVLMLWALLAFAMSTANAFTMSCATIISRDLVGQYAMHNMPEGPEKDQKAIRIGKIGVLVIVIMAAVFSLSRSMFITDYAYQLATPGFAQIIPAMLGGLFWKRASKSAALVGTFAGLAVLVVTTFIIPAPLGVHQIIWSLGVNALLYIGLTIAVKPEKASYNKYMEMEKGSVA